MQTLYRFGFKQTLRGAIIVGLIGGFMLALQGVAYQKTYSSPAAQEKFAKAIGGKNNLLAARALERGQRSSDD